MIRLQSKAITFNWPVIPTLQHEQWIKICHLNVRGYLNHISDIKTDPDICSSDITCFTETHLRNSDVIHINTQPTKHHVSFRKDRLTGAHKGGVMLFVHPQISPSPLNINIPWLEFTRAITSPVPNKQLVIIAVYRRSVSTSIQHFISMLQQLLWHPTLLHKKIFVLGDFNEDLMQTRQKLAITLNNMDTNSSFINQPQIKDHCLTTSILMGLLQQQQKFVTHTILIMILQCSQ